MLKARIKSINLLFLLKTGIGSAAAILIANVIGLSYSPSAGIITLLTIQNTRRETLSLALKRLGAFILMAGLTFLIFQSVGYSAAAFGLFVTFFVALCVVLELKDAIAMNAVLATHFLNEGHMELSLILNETGLLILGMGIGVVLNLIMPRNKELIRKEQLLLEEEMKKTLRSIGSLLLKEQTTLNYLQLERLIDRLLKNAYEEAGNRLLTDTRYLVSYLQMRQVQIGVLKGVADKIGEIGNFPVQARAIAEFMEQIAASFHERNNAEGLLIELKKMLEHFRTEALPVTREEFEARAMLFQIVKELEYFLEIKRDFILDLDKKNMKVYWK